MSIAAIFLVFFSTTTVPVSAQSLNDFNLLGVSCFFPGQTGCNSSGGNVFDILVTFGLALAPFLAIVVIMFGGYKYLFSGLPGDQEDGKKSIQSGVIGLIIVLVANGIVGLVRGSFTANGLNAGALIGQINQISDFLFGLVSVVAVGVIVWGGYKYLLSGLPGDQEDGKKTIQNGVIGLVVVLLARPLASIVGATFGSTGSGATATLALNPASIIKTITDILTTFVIPLSSVITVALFVYGAFLILTSGGDDSKVSSGRDAIRNAVIGLLITLLATTIVQLIIFFIPASQTAPSNNSSQTNQSNTTPNTNLPSTTNNNGNTNNTGTTNNNTGNTNTNNSGGGNTSGNTVDGGRGTTTTTQNSSRPLPPPSPAAN